MQLYMRLGYKYIFPDKLKSLIPVKERLISLNSYYSLIIRYSLINSLRQTARYLRYIKGHITIFLNNI
jgi:hypothetical protein